MRVTIVQNELDFIAGALTSLGIQPCDVVIVSDEAPKTNVFRYTWNADGADSALLERLFHLFNVGEEILPTIDPRRKICDAYRAAGMHSLSVGDVVWLDNRGYRCMPSGWSKI